MKLDKDLLEILRCPETRQELTVADADLVERINTAIAGGTLKDRGGETVNEPIDGGLVRSDGQIVYVVRDDIPEMLVESGIEMAQLA